VLSVIWPTNGTSIAGSNVTVQAQMDDVTATVTATVNSNIVAGLVERSGAVWFNNLPLNSGTNTVTITATDAAGNMSTTNLNVVQSTVSLTINPISSDQMNRTNITVSGTIGDSSEKVRVNGVLATVSGNNWTATHVPVSSTGTAGVNAQVTDSGNNPLAAQSVYQPQPAQVVLASYKKQEHDNYTSSFFISGLHIWETGPTETLDDAIYWSLNSGGAQHYDDDPHDIEDPPDIFNANYPAGANGFSAPWEYTSVTTNFDSLPVSSIEEYGNNYDHVETHVMIEPSGQQSVGQSILYLVQAQVTNEDTGLRLLASAVRFQNQLPGTTTVDVTDSDGSVWSQGLVSAPSGTTPEVTPLTFLPKVSFNTWQVTNMQLKIFAFTNGTAIDLSTNTPEFCVGQKVTFNAVWDYDPGAVSTNYIWAFSSTFVNHSSQASQYASTNWDIDSNIFTTNEPYAYWVSGGNKNVYLHEILHFSNGQNATVSASGQFSMYRPQTHVTTVTGTVAVDDNDILILTPIALHYGTPNDTPGITFSNMVAITNGSIKWLQVVNYGSEDLQRNDGSWIHEPIITNALDNSDPYPSYSDDINTTADSPGFGPSSPSQFQTLSRSNNFSMWLEFKPDGGIWVPLTGC
jgi:uncharacterized membrane protein